MVQALQYLVADSKLVLHGGVSKAGLMGFADAAPHSDGKELFVSYTLQVGKWGARALRLLESLLLVMEAVLHPFTVVRYFLYGHCTSCMATWPSASTLSPV